MQRYMLLAVVAVLGSVELAQADFGGMGMPAFPGQPAAAAPTAPTGDRYGLSPFLRKCFWWRGGAAGCSTCGPTSGGPAALGAANPGVGYPGTPGYAMPGTLVFPNHPYMRSPRDFFMWEPNR